MNSSDPHKVKSIKKSNEIKELLNSGHKVYTKNGIFFLAKSEEKNCSIAVLIKKSVGNAVRRNYCKRIVREYIKNRMVKSCEYNKILFLFTAKNIIKYNDLIKDFDKSFKL